MFSIKRIALVLFATLAAGCAGLAPHVQDDHHGKLGATALTTSYESATLYQATSSTGGQIVFSKGKVFAAVLSQGGTFWVKAHSPNDTSGTIPTTPIPSANAQATGWSRILDGQTVSWGSDGAQASGPGDQVLFIDYWCESGGTLSAISR